MLLGLLAFFIAAPDADRVTSLPGAPPLPSVQFSGFLDGAGGTKLHYWFVTCSADDDWASRPVVLWFNGGPGSSSVLGMLQEQGPLLVARQGGLQSTRGRGRRSPTSWSSSRRRASATATATRRGTTSRASTPTTRPPTPRTPRSSTSSATPSSPSCERVLHHGRVVRRRLFQWRHLTISRR